MPITRRQFELGIDSAMEGWMEKVRTFLADHKDEAFTGEELWGTIYGKPSWQMGQRESFYEALDKLAELREVEIRKISDTWYYSRREKAKS